MRSLWMAQTQGPVPPGAISADQLAHRYFEATRAVVRAVVYVLGVGPRAGCARQEERQRHGFHRSAQPTVVLPGSGEHRREQDGKHQEEFSGGYSFSVVGIGKEFSGEARADAGADV